MVTTTTTATTIRPEAIRACKGLLKLGDDGEDECNSDAINSNPLLELRRAMMTSPLTEAEISAVAGAIRLALTKMMTTTNKGGAAGGGGESKDGKDNQDKKESAGDSSNNDNLSLLNVDLSLMLRDNLPAILPFFEALFLSSSQASGKADDCDESAAGDGVSVKLTGNQLKDFHAAWIGTALLKQQRQLREEHRQERPGGKSGSTSSRIRELFLNNNRIGPLGLHALVRGVVVTNGGKAGLSHLQVLNLNDNELGGRCLRDLHNQSMLRVALTSLLAKCPNLRELSLCRNYIGDTGALGLSEGLLASSSIEVLDLDTNGITDVGAIAIARALQQQGPDGATCTSLRSLDLRRNKIGSIGGVALAVALRYNVSLRHLMLQYQYQRDVNNNSNVLRRRQQRRNRYDNSSHGDDDYDEDQDEEDDSENSGLFCGDFVSMNMLDTSDSIDVNDEVCYEFAATLQKHNATLQELVLHSNYGITTTGALALELAIRHNNYALQRLDVSRTNVCAGQLLNLERLCETNRTSIRDAYRFLSSSASKVSACSSSTSSSTSSSAVVVDVVPNALEVIGTKPDLLYSALRNYHLDLLLRC